jgi:sulfur-oxidizing protein SoxB
MEVDLKLAGRVRGIDVFLGGHTHDVAPKPVVVSNPGGRTLVSNGGSNGKFVAAIDLDLAARKMRDINYTMLPVFSDLLDEKLADADAR